MSDNACNLDVSRNTKTILVNNKKPNESKSGSTSKDNVTTSRKISFSKSENNNDNTSSLIKKKVGFVYNNYDKRNIKHNRDFNGFSSAPHLISSEKTETQNRGNTSRLDPKVETTDNSANEQINSNDESTISDGKKVNKNERVYKHPSNVSRMHTGNFTASPDKNYNFLNKAVNNTRSSSTISFWPSKQILSRNNGYEYSSDHIFSEAQFQSIFSTDNFYLSCHNDNVKSLINNQNVFARLDKNILDKTTKLMKDAKKQLNENFKSGTLGTKALYNELSLDKLKTAFIERFDETDATVFNSLFSNHLEIDKTELKQFYETIFTLKHEDFDLAICSNKKKDSSNKSIKNTANVEPVDAMIEMLSNCKFRSCHSTIHTSHTDSNKPNHDSRNSFSRTNKQDRHSFSLQKSDSVVKYALDFFYARRNHAHSIVAQKIQVKSEIACLVFRNLPMHHYIMMSSKKYSSYESKHQENKPYVSSAVLLETAKSQNLTSEGFPMSNIVPPSKPSDFTEEKMVSRKTKALLNKLSADNFCVIVPEILGIFNLLNEENLIRAGTTCLYKQATSNELNIHIIVDFITVALLLLGKNKNLFNRSLISICQTEFLKLLKDDLRPDKLIELLGDVDNIDEIAEQNEKIRLKISSTMRFLAKLFLNNILLARQYAYILYSFLETKPYSDEYIDFKGITKSDNMHLNCFIQSDNLTVPVVSNNIVLAITEFLISLGTFAKLVKKYIGIFHRTLEQLVIYYDADCYEGYINFRMSVLFDNLISNKPFSFDDSNSSNSPYKKWINHLKANHTIRASKHVSNSDEESS